MGLFDKLRGKKKELKLPPPPLPEVAAEEITPAAPPEVVEDKTVAEKPPEAVKVQPVRPAKAPKHLFVSVQDYQKITEGVNIIKNKIKETESHFQELSELRMQEEKEFGHWREQLEDVQKKITYVEEIILQSR